MTCPRCTEVPTKGACIEDGCITCCQCGRVLKPAGYIPSRMVVSKESGEKILDLIQNPPEPTDALKKLFSGMEKSRTDWPEDKPVYSAADIEGIKENIRNMAEINIKKILGKEADKITIVVEADPDDPGAVTLQFLGPTELVNRIDAWNRKLQ